MKKIYSLVLLFAITVQASLAQTNPTSATQYFSKTSIGVALEDMTVSTTLLDAVRELDQASAETSIGFPFQFVSKSFNSFQVISSGAVVLSTAGVQSTNGLQALFPWADDLFTGDNGYVKYKVVGTTNRKLVIEFYLSRFVGKTSPAIADKKFQVWLYEKNNRIDFVYGDGTVVGANAIVGLSGSIDNGDIYQVNTTSHSTFIPTIETYSSTWPGFGRSYQFSPVEFVTVEPVASINANGNTSVCKGSSVLLSASLADGIPTGYQWFKNGAPIQGATAAQYSANESGSYTAQVQHEAGTATSQLINVFVTSLSASVQSTNITCNANSNGSIAIANASGGNSVYEYSLGNGVWQQNEVFPGVAAGTYTVLMRSGVCQQQVGTVTISDVRVSPVVTIATANGGACANVTLTASPANAASYSWSNGATGSSITLGDNDADGKYTVTVGNGVGCTGTGSYVYNKENQLNSYVIIASKAVSLGENNTVNGAIGNNGTLPVYIDKNSTVSSFIKSALLKLNSPVTVGGAISYNAPTVALPTVYTNTSVTSTLPSFTTADNFAGTISANYEKLVIGKNARVTISGNVYGNITIKDGAEVTFTSLDISIDDLQTNDGYKSTTSGEYTTLNFAPKTIIRVKNKVVIAKRNKVNAAGATFYLSDNRPDQEKFTIEGANTIFAGNIILVKGNFTVKGTNDTEPCIITGAFICETIVSDKYVTWNRNICNEFAPRGIAGTQAVANAIAARVSVYPNPAATGKFNVAVSTAVPAKAELLVVNESGVQVKKETYQNVIGTKIIPVNLSNQPAGVYLVKVVTSQGSQTIKVVVKK